MVKNLPAKAGDARDMDMIPGMGRSPGEGNGNSLQYSCLEIPWTGEPSGLQSKGHKELDITEQLSTHSFPHKEHRWRAWEARAIGSCSISVIFYVHFCGVVLTIGKSLHCTSSGVFLRCSTVFSQSIN